MNLETNSNSLIILQIDDKMTTNSSSLDGAIEDHNETNNITETNMENHQNMETHELLQSAMDKAKNDANHGIHDLLQVLYKNYKK